MPVSRLLLQPRDPDSVVAWRWEPERGAAAPTSWRRFRADVAALSAIVSDQAPGRWLLATEDAYPFAVGLFALWHSGRSVISPPNNQQGTLGQLQTEAAGVICDRADWFPSGVAIDPCEVEASGGEARFQALPLDALAVELFTSGTTGAGKSVAKRLSNLQEEVLRLEALWGQRMGAATIFGTASHQHLYGMLFRVLWPLSAGRAFQSELVLHASELIPRMRARRECVLASVPSHLKRMVRQRGARELGDFCRTTFSSGGLLHSDTAQAWKQAVGYAPLEVFGSTETGGIAWRAQNQLPEDLGWTPFPDVELDRGDNEGGVRVRSPFVSEGAPGEGITIGDRISWRADGRFLLGGRADRVVKVGEKRLDLAQMESALRSHPFVEEIALLLVEQEGEARVAGVVVASDEGRGQIAKEGRIAYGRSLSESLAPHWDRVVLPRLWRTVESLPENAQGKSPFEALRRLFETPPPTVTHDLLAKEGPEVLERTVSESSVLQSCARYLPVPPAR